MSLVFTGRLVFTGPIEVDGAPEIEKYMIGGALLTMKGQPVTKSDGWEMCECEVIIRPTKWHRKSKYPNARIDHMIQSVGDDDAWQQAETPPKDIMDELMG